MARSYALDVNGTAVASSTLPFATLISATTVRPKVFDVMVSSDATPADNTVKFQFQRFSTSAGTAGSTPVLQAFDPADPAAITTAGLLTFSGGPTLTANAFLLQFAQNQRATVRWVAAPTKELVMPATAANGLAIMTPVIGGSGYNVVLHTAVEE